MRKSFKGAADVLTKQELDQNVEYTAKVTDSLLDREFMKEEGKDQMECD